MKWYITSLVTGIVMLVVGIVMLIFNMRLEAALFFILGAGFLALDFTPNAMGEFGNIPTQVLIKKIIGVIALLAGIVIFALQLVARFG
jgi:hypothetical protein